jgi:hypothetical protein
VEEEALRDVPLSLVVEEETKVYFPGDDAYLARVTRGGEVCNTGEQSDRISGGGLVA